MADLTQKQESDSAGDSAHHGISPCRIADEITFRAPGDASRGVPAISSTRRKDSEAFYTSLRMSVLITLL
jgi:hypothetical protein